MFKIERNLQLIKRKFEKSDVFYLYFTYILLKTLQWIIKIQYLKHTESNKKNASYNSVVYH